jgi:hypothetical protein
MEMMKVIVSKLYFDEAPTFNLQTNHKASA